MWRYFGFRVGYFCRSFYSKMAVKVSNLKGDNLEKQIEMNAKRTGRLQIGALSEFYEDLLRADSFLANNSLASQGKSLLQAFLGQKESKIKERVAYLAKKRNISFDEMWSQIQSGAAEQLTRDELKEIQGDE